MRLWQLGVPHQEISKQFKFFLLAKHAHTQTRKYMGIGVDLAVVEREGNSRAKIKFSMGWSQRSEWVKV